MDGDKQIVDAFRLVATYEHLTKVGIFEDGPKRVHALFQDFFSARHKKQSARLVRILFAEALIIQRRNDSLASTGSCNYQIASIATDLSLCLQLVQNLLLIGIGGDVHGVNFGVVGAKVFSAFSARARRSF